MILSMTGFGKGVASSPTKKITVEVRSLNSKQLDLTMRVPVAMREYEVQVRPLLADKIVRGKVELSVTVECLGSETSAKINTAVLQDYKDQISELVRDLYIPEPSDWVSLLLRLPDALRQEVATDDPDEGEAFIKACSEACDKLCDFRRTEGAKLEKFFAGKIQNITELLAQVEPYENERVPAIRRRLEEQLSKLDSIDFDRGRLEQEMIFYIEKLDVNEEKLRLRSHLSYFMDTMREGKDQGKKLGFIAQEMGREINTLGSKANHAEIQKLVVKMKDELEQIKEQVLNVL
jgi:uncharacterized protein (TIGR00255 family)